MKSYYLLNKEKLNYTKTMKPYYNYVVILICGLTIGYSVSFLFHGQRETKFLPQEEKLIVLKNKEKFSKEALKKKINELNIKHPDIVFAQAFLESGGFKSKKFIENNNMFGMKQAQSRPNTSIGVDANGFAIYDWWDDSLIDYSMYQSAYLNHLNDRHEYLEYLKRNYASDTTYISKLKSIIEKEWKH